MTMPGASRHWSAWYSSPEQLPRWLEGLGVSHSNVITLGNLSHGGLALAILPLALLHSSVQRKWLGDGIVIVCSGLLQTVAPLLVWLNGDTRNALGMSVVFAVMAALALLDAGPLRGWGHPPGFSCSPPSEG